MSQKVALVGIYFDDRKYQSYLCNYLGTTLPNCRQLKFSDIVQHFIDHGLIANETVSKRDLLKFMVKVRDPNPTAIGELNEKEEQEVDSLRLKYYGLKYIF